MGYDGFLYTLLVYETIPKLGLLGNRPAVNVYQEDAALRSVAEVISKHLARCQISNFMQRRYGPVTADLSSTLFVCFVLMKRLEKDN